MNYVHSYISLELCAEIGNVFVPVRKGESMRKIHVSLKNNGTPYKITDGVTAKLSGKYPNGTTFLQNATVDGDTVTYVLSTTDTANVGDISCEVKLIGSTSSDVVISPSFTIKVFDVSGSA